ncbi:MAG: DUF4129 domain-containing protein [Cyanobacteria bacterium]|nr:DUF4129 domain-containing protein [Cyanobacteriota bacterium]
MHSRRNLRPAGAVTVVLLLAVSPAAQEQPTVPAYTQEEIDAAIQKVKQDPNIGGTRTMRMLKWTETERKPRNSNRGWLSWVTGFFGWGMQSARYLVWLGLAGLAGWLGLYLFRAIQTRGLDVTAADTFVPPTHVRNLDIRPESLPPNIGAAAWKLWERGDHRAALSLLYRGLLSRLTHVHRVPILDSTTEGDCLVLLSGRVPAKTGDYAAQLVEAWRGFVYGGTAAPTPAVQTLCDGFAGALDRSVARKIEGGE